MGGGVGTLEAITKRSHGGGLRTLGLSKVENKQRVGLFEVTYTQETRRVEAVGGEVQTET